MKPNSKGLVNMVRKEENAGDQHFLLSTQFLRALFRIVESRDQQCWYISVMHPRKFVRACCTFSFLIAYLSRLIIAFTSNSPDSQNLEFFEEKTCSFVTKKKNTFTGKCSPNAVKKKKRLYDVKNCFKHYLNYPFFSEIIFTITPHNILSMPKASFLHNHRQNNGQRQEKNKLCRNDYY